ncbi:hypothetical protein B0H16DRAFT_802651 [Mycena metata]|uniref:F-box domain-containing protein n=1 Tax=Mycena metata TaxID=1033252 RepID=A0AAD7K5U0_9AGAR|nr:hypothetical protein B0H16DRAFT_802651 [Mycena metata]
MALFEYHPPQASVRHRLRYNILPTETERKDITESISTAQHRLSTIRVIGLGTPQNALEEQALSDYISEYSSLIAPIRRLNLDVLSILFLDPDIHQEVKIGRRTLTLVRNPYNPLVLASVSYHWRSVIMETPELWSRIRVRSWLGQSGLDHLQRCVRNSKDFPLSLVLDLATGVHDMRIMNEVMLCAERWRVLDVSIKTGERIHFLDPARGRLRDLQKICFNFEGSDGSTPEAPFDGFMGAPKLRSVKIVAPRSIQCIPPLPFHQITNVSFAEMDDRMCADALTLFTSARHVEFSTNGLIAPPPIPPPQPRLHATVTIVTIDGPQQREPMYILHHLITPNLEQLNVSNCMAWHPQSISIFLTRSASPLRQLSLSNVRLRAGELLALLRATPTLEVLELRDLLPNSITNTLVVPLTPAASNTNLLLPALKRVVIVGTYLFTTEALLCMLEGRAATLTAVDVVLATREVGPVERARFVASRTASTEILRLVCLDEKRSLVSVR